MGKDVKDIERPRRVTAQTVADQAGVSRSAVSRAFTKGGYVETEKRSRIYAVAAELGYQPNALAAGLKGGRSLLVAIVAGDVRNAHDREFVFRLCQALNQEGLWPLMITGGRAQEGIAVEDALRFPLDAIIVRGGSMSGDLVDRCGKLGIPMICYGRKMENSEADAVYCRNADGMRLAADLLLAKGRRRFGFIAGLEGFYASDERRRGLLDALEHAGLGFEIECPGDFTVEGGYTAAQRLLDQKPDIDAIVCANDASAIGALGALQRRGLDVPHDISITGFDDTEMARWPMFSLTTVRNPIDPTVGAMIALIKERFSSPNRPNETIIIEPELRLRDTH